MRVKNLRFAVVACLLAAIGHAQDSQPLGDVARQQRQQKEQSKSTKDKDATPAKVITSEEIPARPTSEPAIPERRKSAAAVPSGEMKPSAEVVKFRIQSQKDEIASLQKQIDEVTESIRFAPANCARGCEQWNERQVKKQEQVEQMQEQMEDQKKMLEVLQESARKMGYGSSVYDP